MHTYQEISLIPGKVIELSTELSKPSPFYFGNRISDKLIDELSKHDFDKLFFLKTVYINSTESNSTNNSKANSRIVSYTLCQPVNQANTSRFWSRCAKS